MPEHEVGFWAREISQLLKYDHDGAFLFRGPFKISSQCTFTRQPGWVPDTPLGVDLQLTGGRPQITWVGRTY